MFGLLVRSVRSTSMPVIAWIRNAGLFEARDRRRSARVRAHRKSRRRRTRASASPTLATTIFLPSRTSTRRSDVPRDDVDAFCCESIRQRIADVVVLFGQQDGRSRITIVSSRPMRAKKLTEFARGVPAAEHDDRFRNAFEFERRVAIDDSRLRASPGSDAARYGAAGCNDEFRRSRIVSSPTCNFVRRDELARAPCRAETSRCLRCGSRRSLGRGARLRAAMYGMSTDDAADVYAECRSLARIVQRHRSRR